MRRSIRPIAPVMLVTLLALGARPRRAAAQAEVFVQLQTPAQGQLFAGACASPAKLAGGNSAEVFQMTDTAGAGPGVLVFTLDMRAACLSRVVQALVRHEPVSGSIGVWQHGLRNGPYTLTFAYQLNQATLSRVRADSAGTTTLGLMHVELVSPSWTASAGDATSQTQSSATGSGGSTQTSSTAGPSTKTALNLAQLSGAPRTAVATRRPLRKLTIAQLPRVVRAQPAPPTAPTNGVKHPEWLASPPKSGNDVTLLGTTTTFPPEPNAGTFLGIDFGFDARVPVGANGRATGPATITIAPIRKWIGNATPSLQSAASHHEVLRSATLTWVRRLPNGQSTPAIRLELQDPVLTSDVLGASQGGTTETVTLSASGATVWDEGSDYTSMKWH